MISKLFRAIIMGPPGSGKGTISKRIVKDFGMQHLSSGDLLRTQILNKTVSGLEAEKYTSKGALVPDDVMVDLILGELATMNQASWLLDGFPRTHAQAEALHVEQPVNVVINLDVPFDVIVSRISGRWTHPASGRIYNTEFNPPMELDLDDITGEPLVQRDDDKPDVVKRRLEAYKENTEPVLQFYKKLGILEMFHGSYSNEIWPHVHSCLSSKTSPLQYTQYNK